MAGILTERIIVDEAISAYYGVRKSADRDRDGIAKTGFAMPRARVAGERRRRTRSAPHGGPVAPQGVMPGYRRAYRRTGGNNS